MNSDRKSKSLYERKLRGSSHGDFTNLLRARNSFTSFSIHFINTEREKERERSYSTIRRTLY